MRNMPRAMLLRANVQLLEVLEANIKIIAGAIKESGGNDIVHAIADALAEDDPRFDKLHFMQACDVWEDDSKRECGNCGRLSVVDIGEDFSRCERCANITYQIYEKRILSCIACETVEA